MSLRNYSTVQPFSCSVPTTTAQQVDFSTQSSRSPCVKRRTKCLRPVLCTKVLQDSSYSNQRHPPRPTHNGIGTYHKTPSGEAWVEHEVCSKANNQQGNWERAQEYNEHIENMQQEKALRLVEFQKEVKLRVKRMEEEKQLAMLSKTYRDVELERKVAHKTAFLAQASIPNASEVMVQGRNNLIVKENSLKHPTTAAVDGMTGKYTEAGITEVNKLHQTIEFERKLKKSARQKLVSKQVASNLDDELPGGFWKDTSNMEFPAPPDDLLAPTDDEQEMDDLSLAVDSTHLEDLETADCKKENPHALKGRRGVHPLLITGQEEEEVRKQEVKQRALLRRLYMDIEREQVKEYKKMKSHLNRIIQIKKRKEEERKRQEQEAALELLMGASPLPVPSGTAGQQAEHERQIRKQKESRRYIKALRSMLKEKIDRLGIDVPPLCSCGDDIWATHPDLCANNCPFYKNPKGYERAVHALLASCDIHD